MKSFTIPIPNYVPSMDDRGVTFLVGQNAQDNHAIIDESVSPQDLWFHLEGESSSHVVAKVPLEVNEIKDRKKRKDVIRKIAKQGAILCKQHSRRKSSKEKVSVMYTEIKNVTKTLVPGEVKVMHSSVINL